VLEKSETTHYKKGIENRGKYEDFREGKVDQITLRCCAAGLLNMSTLSQSLKDGVWEVAEEIHAECVPQRGLLSEFRKLAENLHQPYFPIYERPGWLKQYVMGPHDANFVSVWR
jgi:hypothetical protein